MTQFPARLIALLLLSYIIQTGLLEREITTKQNWISTREEL